MGNDSVLLDTIFEEISVEKLTIILLILWIQVHVVAVADQNFKFRILLFCSAEQSFLQKGLLFTTSETLTSMRGSGRFRVYRLGLVGLWSNGGHWSPEATSHICM